MIKHEENTAEGFLARLQVCVDKFKNVSAAARAFELKDAALRKYLAGTMPGLEPLRSISTGAGVSLDWLVNGIGSPDLGSAGQAAFADGVSLSRSWTSPQVLATVWAVTNEERVGLVGFREDWLRRHGIPSNSARVITAKGDSMEPTIRDGDQLLVDCSVDRIQDQGIYVAIFEGMVLVKRVQVRADGSVVLKSDNGLYEDDVFTSDHQDQLKIAGRVMWYGRSI